MYTLSLYFIFITNGTMFQMFDWIYSNKEAFLVNYVDIGHSHSSAKKLQDEHHSRTHNSNVGIVDFSKKNYITRIEFHIKWGKSASRQRFQAYAKNLKC